MSNPTQLIYWRGSGDVRTDVLNALAGEGYDLRVVRTFEDVLDLCERQAPAMIVVDASTGENEASVRVVELSGAERLFSLPILFFSNQASSRAAVLSKQYSRFLAVNMPFSISSFLQQLRGFSVSPKPAAAVPPDEPVRSGSEAPPVEPHLASPDGAVRLPGKATMAGVVYRNKLLRNLDPANLSSSYGGELFCVAEELNHFDDQLLIPTFPDRALLLRCLEEISAKNEWLAIHARRVAFISSALANALHWHGERDRKMRVGALVMNWGMRDRSPGIVTADLFFPQSRVMGEEIIEGLTESSNYAASNLGDPEASRLIVNVARLLGNSLPDSPELALEAQTLLAAELTDRACWGTGAWDPYGAHRALRKLRHGTPFMIVDEILDGLGRVLSEAASARQSTRTFLSEEGETAEREQSVVSEALEEARTLFGMDGQVAVQVADLRPGMTLSRPIVSWDGKLILRANIPLSAELIHRLWQMATIRPIRPPISVLAR